MRNSLNDFLFVEIVQWNKCKFINIKGENVMKKLFAFILVIVMALTLCACIDTSPSDTDGNVGSGPSDTDGNVEPGSYVIYDFETEEQQSAEFFTVQNGGVISFEENINYNTGISLAYTNSTYAVADIRVKNLLSTIQDVRKMPQYSDYDVLEVSLYVSKGYVNYASSWTNIFGYNFDAKGERLFYSSWGWSKLRIPVSEIKSDQMYVFVSGAYNSAVLYIDDIQLVKK